MILGEKFELWIRKSTAIMKKKTKQNKHINEKIKTHTHTRNHITFLMYWGAYNLIFVECRCCSGRRLFISFRIHSKWPSLHLFYSFFNKLTCFLSTVFNWCILFWLEKLTFGALDWFWSFKWHRKYSNCVVFPAIICIHSYA